MIHFRLLRKTLGVTRPPFDVVKTLDDLYRTANMQDVADMVRYAAADNALTAVVGDVGSGKTHSIRRALIDESRRGTLVVEVFTPNKHKLAVSSIKEAFAEALNESGNVRGNRGAVRLRAALLQRVDAKQDVLLHVDEAHRLNKEVLHALKEMWEWRAGGEYQSLFGVILSGWPEFMTRCRTKARDVWQRLAAGNILEMGLMSEMEVSEYLEHRLAQAGCRRKVFEPEAVAVLAREAKTPLRVNELAMRMLIDAAALGKRTVTGKLARAIVERRTASLRERIEEAGLTVSEVARELKEIHGDGAVSRPTIVAITRGNYSGSKATTARAIRQIEDLLEGKLGTSETQSERAGVA